MGKATYFLYLLLFTALVWTASWIITHFALYPTPAFVPLQFTYFTIITGGIHLYLSKSAQGRPIKFVNAYMLASTVKLLLSLTIILIVAYLKFTPPIPFVLHFGALYLIYTVFEITVILRTLRAGGKK